MCDNNELSAEQQLKLVNDEVIKHTKILYSYLELVTHICEANQKAIKEVLPKDKDIDFLQEVESYYLETIRIAESGNAVEAVKRMPEITAYCIDFMQGGLISSGDVFQSANRKKSESTKGKPKNRYFCSETQSYIDMAYKMTGQGIEINKAHKIIIDRLGIDKNSARVYKYIFLHPEKDRYRMYHKKHV